MTDSEAGKKQSRHRRLARRQALRYWWHYLKWPLTGALWLVTIALGYAGFRRLTAVTGDNSTLLDWLYQSIQLFALQSSTPLLGPKGWELEVARYLAPTLAAYTAIQALVDVFSDQLMSLRLTFMHDHMVICGLGRKGYLLAQGFRTLEMPVVVIEKNEDDGQIDLCRELGIPVLVGDATDPNQLRRARVSRAQAVIALFGNDGNNADVAAHVRDLAAKAGSRGLTCVLHIVDPHLYSLFREQELPVEQVGGFRQEFFNVFDQGARLLLKRFPPFPDPLEFRPHPLVIGLGRMGQSLVVHMARSWRPSFSTTGERLRITILDRDARRRVESLLLRYPQLGKVCELVPITMEIRSPEFERAQFLYGAEGARDVTSVYVSVDDDSFALDTALALRQHVRGTSLPIVVRMTQKSGLAALLHQMPDEVRGPTGFEGLYAFGLLDETCTPELVLGGTHESLARAIHEKYVLIETEKGHTPETNPSMVPWDRLPVHLKESNRLQADHTSAKLAKIGCGIAPLTDWDAESFSFATAEVETMAEMEYLRYKEERQRQAAAAGTKSRRAGAAAPIVPWQDLSEEEKEKNRAIVRGIPELLAQAGFQVYRLPPKG